MIAQDCVRANLAPREGESVLGEDKIIHGDGRVFRENNPELARTFTQIIKKLTKKQ